MASIRNLNRSGFLGGQEVGSGFGSGLKSRLAKGQTIGSSFGGGISDMMQTLTPENIKKRTLEKAFAGPGLVSAYARGKLKQKYGTSPTKASTTDPSGETSQVSDSSYLKVIAKASMSLPGMARDMNVLRQNVQKLVKLKAGPQKKGSKAYASSADAYFLKEDERERALEAQRQKTPGSKSITPTPEKKEDSGNILDSISKTFSSGFLSAIKSLFSAKMLGAILKKVFLPIAIIGTLFSGITDGFKRYKETGSFTDAIVAGLGGMLEFVSFGLFGEDTLKSLFSSISNFFQPITDTISSIFTGIKNFVIGLFGGKVDVKDDAPAKADSVKPTMPDPKQFALTSAKASGASDQKASDLGDMFGAVGKGDAQGLFDKAQAFAKKYPEPAPAATAPTPMASEGVPMDQAQRNYELNKKLTGEASKALGVPLQAPAPPTPATPPAPVATAPTPAPEMSDSDKVKQLEGYIEGNKKRFARREADAARHIASFKKRYENDPSRVKELEDEYKQTLDVERKEMEEANAGFQRQIDALKKSSGGKVTAGASSAPAVEAGGSSAPALSASGGGGGSGGGASVASGSTAPSGSDISQTSSTVAEAQRMESAADQGSVVNAPTTNNQSASAGKTKPPAADVYNSDFAKMLATT